MYSSKSITLEKIQLNEDNFRELPWTKLKVNMPEK
jgi:hypothetical protein